MHSRDMLGRFGEDNHRALSIRTGSWRFLERIEFNRPHDPTELRVCINGVIFYMADTSMSPDMVVSVDVRTEEFSMIQSPDDVSEFAHSVGFIEYGGKPASFYYTHIGEDGLVNLWVLEDGGKWSKQSLVLPPCHTHLVKNTVDDLFVWGTTRNGEVILTPKPLISPYYILSYDLQKNHLRKINIRGIPDHGFIKPYFNLKLMDKSESIMHLET